jgi:rhodanese-related sulfurtransferase
MHLFNHVLISLTVKQSVNFFYTYISVFVVCRRGNDSLKGVLALQESLSGLNVSVKDIIGGLHSWAKDIDPSFPVY